MITKETIKKVSKIARLNLSEKEQIDFAKDAEEILKIFSKLDEISIKSEIKSIQPVELLPELRKDEKINSISQENALSGTRHKEAGFFKAPKTL